MKRTATIPAMLLPLYLAAFPLWPQQPAPWAVGESRPEDLATKLVTIGPSDPIYTWWGHSALIVEDRRLGVSRFYNYGLFSFEQENFLLNFAMGRLWFQVGASDTSRELSFYRYLGRAIRIQTLNLTPDKRLEMARFLENNILPENRTYLYDHYNDNCATRVRDLIDASVDGALAVAAAVPGRMTLREQTRRFTEHAFLMDWLLMFLMSAVIDQPTTRWQEMFLPGELEKNVGELLYIDENGEERPLVAESILYNRGSQSRTIPERARPGWPRALIPGLALGLLALSPTYWMRKPAARRRTGWTLFGLFSAAVGLIFGVLGSVLMFMSSFTDHTVTYGNENLFIANPLLLLAVPLGLAVAFGDGRRSRRLLQGLWLLLAAVAAVYLVMKIFPLFEQRNAAALAAILPPLFGFAACSWLSWKRV